MVPHWAQEGLKGSKKLRRVCPRSGYFGDIFGVFSGGYFRCFFGTLFLGASVAFWCPGLPKRLLKGIQNGAKTKNKSIKNESPQKMNFRTSWVEDFIPPGGPN